MTDRPLRDDAEVLIRDIGPADQGWLLTLNNASVPHVNPLDRDSLAGILALAAYARCPLQDGGPAGALIALRPGTAYGSHLYRWFSERHADFVYIDRVMIDGSSRKSGLGRLLYADLERFALADGAAHLACEVNNQPPNPVSMRFHQAFGFHPVGELANEDSSKCVVLMMKPVAGAPSRADATRSSRRAPG